MVSKRSGEQTSERKRISIPRADESALEWWDAQEDPGQSVRLLIRAEIERSGYVDIAFRRVEQVTPAATASAEIGLGGGDADAVGR